MFSWVIILGIVVAVVFGIVFAVLGTKCRKRYLSNLRKMSRRKWKKEHQKTLRGNFVLTYDTPIEETYLIEKGSVLGQGSFGIVVLGKHRETGNQYAIKFINKNSEERKRLERELRLLKDVDHPNIVGFVMELCSGGHLGRFLEKQPQKHLSEDHAKTLIRQLLSAVTHMHSRGICHRDIKLQNILMENQSPDAQIKLIDFGFGTRFIGATPLRTRCGTPYTTAPEVFRESYDERCDVWSAGVVAYIVICGRRPFESLVIPGELEDAGKTNLVTNILLCRYHFNHRQWKRVSPLAIDFVQKMMHPDYKSRWHAKESLVHQWIEPNNGSSSDVPSGVGMDRVVENLRRASFMSQLHLTSMLAVVFSQPSSRTDDLRAIFQNFDTDHNGTLSKGEFINAMQAMSSHSMSKETADKLFEAIDANHDKQISFSEFLAATLDPREVQIGELNKAFEMLDLEKKGYITSEDLARVLDSKQRSHRRLSRNGSQSQRDLTRGDTDLPEEKRGEAKQGNVSRKTSFDVFAMANVGIPEGNSLVSVEDSEFSHSQDMSNKYLQDGGNKPKQQQQQQQQRAIEYKLAQQHEEDDEDEEVEVKRVISRTGSVDATTDVMDPKLAARINDILASCDTNGDGVISYSEFLWAMADGDGLFEKKSYDEDDSDDEGSRVPPPMLNRRVSSMPIIKQDEDTGTSKALQKTADFNAKKTRRNSTTTSSLNIHHDIQSGRHMDTMHSDSGLPFGSPESYALLRMNSQGKSHASEFEFCSSPNSSLRMCGSVSRSNSGLTGVESMYSLERGQSVSSLVGIEMTGSMDLEMGRPGENVVNALDRNLDSSECEEEDKDKEEVVGTLSSLDCLNAFELSGQHIDDGSHVSQQAEDMSSRTMKSIADMFKVRSSASKSDASFSAISDGGV